MTLRSLLLAFLALAVGSVGIARLSAAEIVPLAGKPVKGTIASVDAQFLTYKDESDAEVKIPIKDMSAVELGPKAPTLADVAYDELELIDGSLLRTPVGSAKFKLKQLSPGLLPGPTGVEAPTITVPLEAVFFLIRDGHKPANRADWKKLLATRGKRDLFVIREKINNNEVLNQLEGTVATGNAEGDRVEFEQANGQKADYALSRATGGIVFNPPARTAIPPTVCKVIDVFGNVVIATSVEFAGSGLKVKSVGGAMLEYKTLASVSKLDFSQGNLAYLSDLDPEIEAPKAVEGEPHFTYTKNKTAMGLPLRLDGKTYPKGLWIYPETALKYKLGGEFKTFRVVIGVDETVQIATSEVKLTIEADGKMLFNETVKRTDKPLEKVFDMKDAKELKITVERVSLYTGSQLNLGDARLQK